MVDALPRAGRRMTSVRRLARGSASPDDVSSDCRLGGPGDTPAVSTRAVVATSSRSDHVAAGHWTASPPGKRPTRHASRATDTSSAGRPWVPVLSPPPRSIRHRREWDARGLVVHSVSSVLTVWFSWAVRLEPPRHGRVASRPGPHSTSRLVPTTAGSGHRRQLSNRVRRPWRSLGTERRHHVHRPVHRTIGAPASAGAEDTLRG